MDPKLRSDYDTASPAGKRRALATVLSDHEAFVRSMVAKFVQGHGADAAAIRADLHQAGRLGLIRAFEGWVPSRGGFMTFAYWKILHELQCALRDSRGIAIPRRSMLSTKLQQLRDRIRATEGREATAEELGISEACLRRWQQAYVVFYSATTDNDWTALAAIVADTYAEGINLEQLERVIDRPLNSRRVHDDRFLSESGDTEGPKMRALTKYRARLSATDRRKLDAHDPEAIALAQAALCP